MEKIILKPFTVEMITPVYLAWFHDPDVCKYTENFESVWDINDGICWLNAAQARGDKVFGIFTGTGKHIGNCAIDNMDKKNSHAGMSFLIGNKDYWGRGIAVMAGAQLMRIGFETFCLNKMWIGTLITNFGMIRVAAKLGLLCYSILPQEKYSDGEFVDVVRLSMCRTEYMSRLKETNIDA